MKKRTHKHKKNQRKNSTLNGQGHIHDLLGTILSSAGLNKYEVNKRIKVDEKADKELDLEIDLHRLTAEETDRLLSTLLGSKKLKLRTLTLIHGFHHGMVLKEYINYDFRHDRVAAVISDALNEGITHLKVTPWETGVLKAEKAHKRQSKKVTNQHKKTFVPGIEEEKNDAKFVLEMIKENVRASHIKSKKYNDAFSSVLNDQEKKYSEAIFSYEFDLSFFMNHLLEFCVYEEKTYMRIRYKKKSMDELTSLMNKLTENKEGTKVVIVIELGKAVLKQINNVNNLGAGDNYDYALKDNGLVISNTML